MAAEERLEQLTRQLRQMQERPAPPAPPGGEARGSVASSEVRLLQERLAAVEARSRFVGKWWSNVVKGGGG